MRHSRHSAREWQGALTAKWAGSVQATRRLVEGILAEPLGLIASFMLWWEWGFGELLLAFGYTPIHFSIQTDSN
jgi:hypothetical protein